MRGQSRNLCSSSSNIPHKGADLPRQMPVRRRHPGFVQRKDAQRPGTTLPQAASTVSLQTPTLALGPSQAVCYAKALLINRTSLSPCSQRLRWVEKESNSSHSRVEWGSKGQGSTRFKPRCGIWLTLGQAFRIKAALACYNLRGATYGCPPTEQGRT